MSKPLTISFPTTDQQLVKLGQRTLNFGDKSSRTNTFWGFNKKINIDYYRIEAVLIEIPDSIVFRQAEQALLLQSGLNTQSRPRHALQNLNITSESFPVSIFFDPSQIKDYTGKSDREELRFEIIYQPVEGDIESIQREEFTVTLQFKKTSVSAEWGFEISPEFRNGVEYSPSKRHEQVGAIWLNTRSDYSYVNLLDCRLRVISQRFPGALYFGESSTNSSEGKATTVLAKLPGNKKEQIPVYIDLREVDAPFETLEGDVQVIVEQKRNGKYVPSGEETRGFFITPDTRVAELDVSLLYGNVELQLNEQHEYEVPVEFVWNPKSKGTSGIFNLQLGNIAESGNGFVDIQNLQFSFQSEPTIHVKDNLTLDEIFQFYLNGDSESGSIDLKLPSRENSSKSIEVRLPHSMIDSLGDDEFQARVKCALSFDYIVDVGNYRAPKKKSTYNAVIVFDLRKSLGGHWLACDLGTSAIVVAFDSQVAFEEASLLPLQSVQRKRSRIEREYYTEQQIQEFNTPFLSSTVLLESGKSYPDLFFLAPNLRRETDPRYLLLPYLKALIGHEFVPHLGAEYDDFTYYKIRESTQGDIPEPANAQTAIPLKNPKSAQQTLPAPINAQTTLSKDPIEVNEVLQGVYDIIIRDFVKNILTLRRDTEGDLNKVILTIPNNFTPRHTDSIRRIIRNNFPEYFRHENHILFISESDAVACYYLIKWEELNRNRPVNSASQFIKKPEYILVYDMGAGTLDLTYIKLINNQDGTKEVHILGRMGIGVAGNYLDYAIARSIEEDVRKTFEYNLVGPAVVQGEKMFRDLLRLHIRNQVKPRLNANSATSFTFQRSGEDKERELNFNISAIRASDPVREFTQKVTKDIFETFFSLFNSPDGVPLAKEGFKLDTVVFSGRASQLDIIHEAVKEEISQWRQPLTDTYYVTQFPNKNTLKSAVVQGALQFAAVYSRKHSLVKFINRNIQARYGFIYLDPSNKNRMGWTFKELLTPSVKSISKKPTQKDGITIFEYDTNIYDTNSPLNDGKGNHIDLGHAAQVFFVQSFSSDTEKDFRDRNLTYVNIMFSLSVAETGWEHEIRRVPVRIEVDKENKMYVTIGNYTNDPLVPMKNQLSKNDTFIDSMWPRLENMRKMN